MKKQQKFKFTNFLWGTFFGGGYFVWKIFLYNVLDTLSFGIFSKTKGTFVQFSKNESSYKYVRSVLCEMYKYILLIVCET